MSENLTVVNGQENFEQENFGCGHRHCGYCQRGYCDVCRLGQCHLCNCPHCGHRTRSIMTSVCGCGRCMFCRGGNYLLIFIIFMLLIVMTFYLAKN